MSATLATDQEPHAPPRRRCYSHGSRYHFVWKVKGNAWQCRVWIGTARGGDVNLGLFTEAEHGSMDLAEWAAGRAGREFVKRATPGRDVWDVVRELQAAGICPAHVLPRYVYLRPDGLYGARRRTGGRLFEMGPFTDPGEASRAMYKLLNLTYPRLGGGP